MYRCKDCASPVWSMAEPWSKDCEFSSHCWSGFPWLVQGFSQPSTPICSYGFVSWGYSGDLWTSQTGHWKQTSPPSSGTQHQYGANMTLIEKSFPRQSQKTSSLEIRTICHQKSQLSWRQTRNTETALPLKGSSGSFQNKQTCPLEENSSGRGSVPWTHSDLVAAVLVNSWEESGSVRLTAARSVTEMRRLLTPYYNATE